MHPNRKLCKVLICSYAFWPSLGGLELTAEKLAYWLHEKGYDVTVITYTDSNETNFPFCIVRRPSLLHKISLFRKSNLIISKHLSLKNCWPVIFFNKKFLIWHATWYNIKDNEINSYIRKKIMLKAINIANSSAVSKSLFKCDGIVHPGYSDIYKKTKSWNDRDENSIVFVGRLSPEKGCNLLLQALKTMQNMTLTIIGDGSDKDKLLKMTEEWGLSQRVIFLGRLNAIQIVDILNNSKVLVVPSVYQEPFGTVALEGLAAGCRVVVSDGGGLPDAAGPSGIIFKSGNISSLIQAIEVAINKEITSIELEMINRHLHENSFDYIANKLMKYLD